MSFDKEAYKTRMLEEADKTPVDFSDFSDFPISPKFGEDLVSGINRTTEMFSINHLFSRVIQNDSDSEFKGHEIDYSLHLARQTEKHPPVLIADYEELVNVNDPVIALTSITDKVEVKRLVIGLPKEVTKKLFGMLAQYSVNYEEPAENTQKPRTLIGNHKILNKDNQWVVYKDGKDPIGVFTSLGSGTAKKLSDKLDIQLDEMESRLAKILVTPNEETENGADVPDLSDLLVEYNLIYKPAKLLKNPDLILTCDWSKVVQEVVSYGKEKDPRLVIIHKATLPKGIDQRANPHSIQALNGGIGKTKFYEVNGLAIDKVTKNSLIGFAKSPDEIYPGMVNRQDQSIALDQVESGNWGILDYLFNIMETGKATVSTGAATFGIQSLSTFNILANPSQSEGDLESDFGSILIHLTNNPVIGRRFGIIAYGTDYDHIQGRDDPGSMRHWKELSRFYKAVEQHTKPQLGQIYENPKTWDYLSKPIEGYSTNVTEILKTLSDNKLYTFFKEHSKAGQTRVRAAALNVAIVENLNKIALLDIGLDELFDAADQVLPEITSINMDSINALISNYQQDLGVAAKQYYEISPYYVKGIINIVINSLRAGILHKSFFLHHMEAKPQVEGYEYASECIDRLLKKKSGLAQLSKSLEQHFGFNFDLDGRQVKINIQSRKTGYTFIPSEVSSAEIGEMEKTEKTENLDQQRAYILKIVHDHGGPIKETVIRDRTSHTQEGLREHLRSMASSQLIKQIKPGVWVFLEAGQ
jgi:hypothetical protein